MMATNPDNKTYLGLGPPWKIPETTLDGRYLIASEGMLRFVNRAEHNETSEFVKTLRILQRYEWSAEMKKHDWFDVELVDDV